MSQRVGPRVPCTVASPTPVCVHAPSAVYASTDAGRAAAASVHLGHPATPQASDSPPTCASTLSAILWALVGVSSGMRATRAAWCSVTKAHTSSVPTAFGIYGVSQGVCQGG